MRDEKIFLPEHRNSIIASVHALLIAIRVNPKLKFVSNYEAKSGGIYEWALVDFESSTAIPVASAVANDAMSAGVVKL